MDSSSTSQVRAIDWTKCCLCQQDKKEELKCPQGNPAKSQNDGYVVLARNIPVFHSLNQMPIKFDPAQLDMGKGIEETLRQNGAKYHENCRLQFNNTKLERAEKRSVHDTRRDEGSRSKVPRKSQTSTLECFLCENGGGELREAMTMKLNKRINECARTLCDGKLLAKLSGGDAVALELKYHPACLVALYNRERDYLKSLEQDEASKGRKKHYPMAFSELVSYINEMKSMNTDGNPPIFKLADLSKLYKQRLQQLGVESPEVHSTRLKDQLLFHIPELRAHHQGRDILLAFEKDVGSILAQASQYGDAVHLAKAASMIRKDMLGHKTRFSNTLHSAEYPADIEQAVPPSLLQFVCMVEHGADIKSQLENGASKSDLAISQLLQFNCFSKPRQGARFQRHCKDRETPFAVYIGMSVFAKTRKRQLIEMLHEHGLSISYDRVLEISAKLGEAVVAQYVEDGVVCPPVLRKQLFTTAAVDNIDHNPTATTAQTSFHGTSLSVFQHPSPEYAGEKREILQLNPGQKVKNVPELPETFTNVRPAYISKNPNPPSAAFCSIPAPVSIQTHLKQEYDWLEEVRLTQNIADATCITWSAHHASENRVQPFEISISALMPLLRDQAHSVATIKHAMEKIREAVSFLNPGQTPVITADQPLYALAKQIQWQWPEEYGENKFVIMFGGLHIEMAALRSLGTLLQDSGWTSALTEAGVASSGTADSFLSASSVTRTRHAHQITACSLHELMQEAYHDYCSSEFDRSDLSLENWRQLQCRESPQFHFWSMVLDMEVTILTLIRSFREGDFCLYREALYELGPYFFANKNINYARWISIHLRDMLSLEQQHPDVASEFHKGNFVVHKSRREFSALAIDQAHEQNNAVIKGDGGAIGLTEDEVALRRWMIAGPEVSRLVASYEEASGVKDSNNSTRHHEQTLCAQASFFEKVRSLSSVLREMGNPFQEESTDLLALDTKNVADPALAEMVGKHYKCGKEQFFSFIDGLQYEDSCPFYNPIKKNVTSFFKQVSEKAGSSKEKVLKDDCQLFARLFISCQNRQCDLDEFFKYENQTYPASLSDNGKLHSCQKSQLAEILQAQVDLPEAEPTGDTIIIDGSALIHALPPRTSKTFEDYAKENIIPKVEWYSVKFKRVDIVFDVYKKSSLKYEARSKRGQGIRRRVTGMSKTPTNWNSFLRDDNNKNELFLFLADKICEAQTTNTIIVTKGEEAISNTSKPLDDVSPCSHEEADTRIFVHARDAVTDGSTSLIIKANDTDIVVIATSVLPLLQELGLENMWIAFGQAASARWIPIHEVVAGIGPQKAKGLPYFHAFTGCDVVSAFRGKGKKTAWQTWNICEGISETFASLSQVPSSVSDSDIQQLEKFVTLMYDRSSATSSVDEARLDLFARKQRPYDSIPPTQASLREHAKRAAYQAGIIWGQATITRPDISSPAEWGWIKKGEMWQVCWTTLPPIAANCQQLTKCSCKKGCNMRCKCFSSGLPCTALCGCTCEL